MNGQLTELYDKIIGDIDTKLESYQKTHDEHADLRLDNLKLSLPCKTMVERVKWHDRIIWGIFIVGILGGLVKGYFFLNGVVK